MMKVALPLPKKLFLMLFLIAGVQIAMAQKGNAQTEQQAIALMKAYQADLGMTIEQAAKFRSKAEEYLIKREEVNNKAITAKAKTEMLEALSDQETTEMANILSSAQLRDYKKQKKKLQPIQN